MPLYSFAARERTDTDKVSAYGVALLKSEFYAAGGRPVIYGAFSVRFEVNHEVGVNDSSGSN
jgi:hypothetical protein